MYGYQQNQGQNQGLPPTSPPLHHPIPQHPIPAFRSPPPADGMQNHGQPQQQQQQQFIPNAFAPGSGGASAGGAGYGNFLNDPSAQIGIEVGRNAVNYGQEYIQKNIHQFVSVAALKYYFQVSNSYVLRKLLLTLFPWRHKSWVRQPRRSDTSGVQEGFCTAKEDINAPDMYIPTMAFTTYILLSAVLAGVQGRFQPKVLGYVSSKAIAFMLVELLFLKLGTYLLSAGSKLLDFVAYSGYKFVGITITMLFSSLIDHSSLKWVVFVYTSTSNSFFLLRSLKYILLPEVNAAGVTQTINHGQRQRRMQFLFIYSFICQFILMWFLIA